MINPYTLGFLREKGFHNSLSENPSRNGSNVKETFEKELNLLISDLKDCHKDMILEAAAIAAYQENNTSLVIQRFVCDDAKHSITLPLFRHFVGSMKKDTI